MPKVLKESVASKASLVQLVRLEMWVRKASKDLLDCRATKVSRAKPDSKVLKGHKGRDQQVLKDHKAWSEQLVRQVSAVCKASKARLAQPEPQAQMEQMVLKAIKALKELQVKMEPKERRELLVRQVLMERMGQMVPKVLKELLVRLERQA